MRAGRGMGTRTIYALKLQCNGIKFLGERESQFRHASETESVWCFVGH